MDNIFLENHGMGSALRKLSFPHNNRIDNISNLDNIHMDLDLDTFYRLGSRHVHLHPSYLNSYPWITQILIQFQIQNEI